MANFQVVPQVTVVNNEVIAGLTRSRLKVPPGVTAYEPKRVSFGAMSKLEPSKIPPPAGLTTATADVEVPNVEKVGSGSAVRWKFSGGDLVLKVEIAIYIIEQYAPIPALFKLIMEHEYLHVLDYQTLATKNITAVLQADSTLKPWLEGEPWTGSAFYDQVKKVWGVEAKRLGNLLDTGNRYDHHKKEIARLAPRIP